MRILDNLIREGWWAGVKKQADLEIDVSERELLRLNRGDEIIKQDPHGAFILIYLSSEPPYNIKIERLPVAPEIKKGKKAKK